MAIYDIRERRGDAIKPERDTLLHSDRDVRYDA